MNRKQRRKQKRDEKRARRPDPAAKELLKQARASLEAGNLGLAEKQFRALTQRDPLNAEPFHMLALIAYQGGRFAEAGEMILEAITRDDSDPLIHANCGAILNVLGRAMEAEAASRHAIALKPDLPRNFSILSAHKYIPPVMEIVAEMPHTRVEGYLAAGHAAAITGWGIFERFVARHGIPVVVAGFEPLDILAGLARLVELIRAGRKEVVNMYPRCVSHDGNRNALEQLWKVFRPTGGKWRGIAHVPNGNLRLRDEFAHLDARRRFDIDLRRLWNYAPSQLTQVCICGEIMAGIANPTNCPLYGKECTPDNPVGACMVSSEGTCRIWQMYGGHPDL